MKKIFFISLLISIGCKQAYTPPLHDANDDFLVVEGFINNGQDSTYIYLTHTFTLQDTGQVTPELHAQLTVEGKDNSSYPLQEWGSGQYGVTSLTLNNALQYRLHIKTSKGKEYVSDFLTLKPSPPIDSISWARTKDGVQIYANTHDPQKASTYYRWEYQQTWEFHSAYYTVLQYVGDSLEPLYTDPYYTCWKYANSSSVLVTSTNKLAKDEVYQFPLVLIPSNSWIISVRYSILVKQYVLTEDAYTYWSDLQKNTEQIGSIFSPQPFAPPKSNIHNVADTSEQVIGFLSAGTLQRQRIFITPDQVPDWKPGGYDVCIEFDIPEDSLHYYLYQHRWEPINPIQVSLFETRYNISGADCVDCRLIGTTAKPSFW
ncbi:MAG TPA: DUF4249 domain-containing protein [Puia sp.]|jgi:hypothetical protein